MFDISKSCVFEGVTEDSHSNSLNTIMEVVVDGKKCKVAVCSDCEDDATPRAIKKVVSSKLGELEEKEAKLEALRAAAAELGFDLVETDSNKLMFPTSKVEEEEEEEEYEEEAAEEEPPPPPKPKKKRKVKKPLGTMKVGDSDFKVQKNNRKGKQNHGLSEEEAKRALEAAKRQAETFKKGGGHASPTSGQAASYQPHLLPESITVKTHEGDKVYQKPQVHAKEMQMVKGAGGVPRAIPKSLKGSDGETNITIIETSDKVIQRRAAHLNQLREYGDGSYYNQTCVVCAGTGMQGKRACHTCGGKGIIIA